MIKLENGRIVKNGNPKDILLEEKSESIDIVRRLSQKGIDLSKIYSIEQLCEVMLGE